MKLNKIFNLFVISLFSFTQLPIGQIYASSLTIDPELENAIGFMYSNGLTKYDKVADFMPNDTLNREQAAKFYLEYYKTVLGKNVPNKIDAKCNFSDINQADATLRESIINSCLVGIFKGFNGKFYPKQSLTKAESLALLVRITKGSQNENLNPWWTNYFQIAKQLGYTKENNVISVDRPVSRYEVSLMLYRARTGGQNPGIKPSVATSEIIDNIDPTQLKDKIMKISFDVPMNRASVESNFKIYPDKAVLIAWDDDKNMNITLKQDINELSDPENIDNLKEFENYVVNIGQGASTSTGVNLTAPIVKTFKLDGTPMLTFVSPQGEIQDLSQHITARFSKPMVALTALDTQPNCPLKIEPYLPGKCVWITTSTFQFRPDKGFPIGGKYNISIPSGLKTIAGDTTINSKEFQISTPNFQVYTTPEKLNKDDSLNIRFNAPVNLQSFVDNFTISGIDKNLLNIDYFTQDGDKVDSIITIQPKSKDWGYGKNYSFTISKSLTSDRGNVGLLDDYKGNLYISPLLQSYSSFIYSDIGLKNLNLVSNLDKSKNPLIILPQDPMILFEFYEDMNLDKSLFELNQDFDLEYALKNDCSLGVCNIVQDKKSIIMKIKGNIEGKLNIKILSSKISNSNDSNLEFNTKNLNSILSFDFIDYNMSCISFQNPMNYEYGDSINNLFDFGGEGRLNYLTRVYPGDSYNKCSKITGKNVYSLYTRLNPGKDINMKISKDLLDEDNYKLDKDYQYNFKTNLALNEDKLVSFVDYNQFNLIPMDLAPLGIGIQTVNLVKIQATVCEGDYDVNTVGFMKNSQCKTAQVDVNDLGFNTNYSVLDLNSIYGKEFDKVLVTLELEKLSADKTKYDQPSKHYYMRTNKSVLAKLSYHDKLLWINDFRSGENLGDEIESIKTYSLESKYSLLGKYIGQEAKFQGDIKFTYKTKGIYELDGKLSRYTIIKLKDGQQLFLDGYYYDGNKDSEGFYLTTDRPLYKPGDTVYIKGTGRIFTPTGFEIKTGQIPLVIYDYNYKQLINQSMKLTSNGDFEFEYKIDEAAKLGNYSINAGNSSIDFQVQEYEKPDFKVQNTVAKPYYLYGDNAQVKVQADYYLGFPLSNGEGNYSIMANPYYFDGGKTKGYTWGEQKSYWYWGIWEQPQYSSIASNQPFNLDGNGTADLSIPLVNKTDSQAQDMTYTLSATVKDPKTSKTVNGNINFNVLRSKYFVGMKMNKYYYDYMDEASIDMISVDTEGNIVPNQNVDFIVSYLEYKKNPENGNFEDTVTSLVTKTLKTSDKGTVNQKYTFSKPGRYKIEAKLGNYITSKTLFVSGGAIFRPADKAHDLSIVFDKQEYNVGDEAKLTFQTDFDNGYAFVSVEKLNGVLGYDVVQIKENTTIYPLKIKNEYVPGLSISVYAVQSLSGSVDSFAQLKEIRLQMQQIEQTLFSGNNYSYMPIIFDMKGYYPIIIDNDKYDENLLNQLATLRKQEALLLQNILPNYQYGKESVKISTDTIKLDTVVKTDKSSYLPADSVQLNLQITDSNGNPVTGQGMISVVDEALLALKQSNSQDIFEYFYANFESNVYDIFNMDNLLKRIDFENIVKKSEDKDDGVERQSYKKEMFGGGMLNATADMAMDESIAESDSIAPSAAGGGGGNESKLRTDFKDLAYYQGTIDIVDGKATINIPKLPDDLTNWSVDGYVITKDTKLGKIKSNIQVQKPLSIIPSVPRFFIAGDTGQISVVIVNTTGNSIDANLSIDASNIAFTTKQKPITINSNSQSVVTFDFTVNPMNDTIDWNNYFSRLNISLKADSYEDAVEIDRKILPYSTPEYSFTNGSTTDISYEERLVLPDFIDKTQGKIDVQLGSNILTNVIDGIDSIANVPYWSAGSILDSLTKIAALKRFYNSVNEIGIYNKIVVKDYNDKEWKLDDLASYLITMLPNYQWTDGGIMYWDECETSYWRDSCSNFDLTTTYLDTVKSLTKSGFTVNKSITDKAFNYYTSQLAKLVESAKANGYEYQDIRPFYTLSFYGDTQTINKYLLPDYPNANNYDKLMLIKIYDTIGNSTKSSSLQKQLENSIIIEARGSLLPGSSTYWGSSSNVSTTALALSTFIEKGFDEKLIIENFARWLVAQKNQDGTFGGWGDTALVLDSLTDYVTYTKEFDNIDFEAKMFINSSESITAKFDSSNKFSQVVKSFPLNIFKFGSNDYNSIGFEKTGNGKLYYDMGFKYFLPVDKIQARDEGIIVNRSYYDYNEYFDAMNTECDDPVYPYPEYRSNSKSIYMEYDMDYSYPSYSTPVCIKKQTKNLVEQSSGKQGDLMVGVIQVVVPHERNNVVVENFIPSGAELVNTNLDNVSLQVKKITGGDSGNWWYSGFDHVENKTDKLLLSADRLYAGTYTYTYVIKLNQSGNYHHRPAVAYEQKKPEIWGRTKGEYFNITK